MLMHGNELLISTVHHGHNWEEDKDHVRGFFDTENLVFIGEVVIMKHLFIITFKLSSSSVIALPKKQQQPNKWISQNVDSYYLS